ncbi:nitroreductase family protein [Nonomuraea thailandensis]
MVPPPGRRRRAFRAASLLLTGRPAPSGGGLYPIEAYVAAGEALSPTADPLSPAAEPPLRTGEQPRLPAALYHYDPVHHVLERLRDGDHVPALTGLIADGTPADLVIVLSAVFWRSMFKYGDFGYRLICQETGVLIAQALAVGERLGLSARAHLRFPDGELDRLLGLDGAREATLAVLTFTGAAASRAAEPPAPSLARRLASRPMAGESRPLPRPMPDGPAAALHRACTLASRGEPSDNGSPDATNSPDETAPDETAPYEISPYEPGSADETGSRDRALRPRPPVRATRILPAPEPTPGPHPARAVARRASPTAGYRPVPFPAGALGAVLAAAGGGYPADLPGAPAGPPRRRCACCPCGWRACRAAPTGTTPNGTPSTSCPSPPTRRPSPRARCWPTRGWRCVAPPPC